MLKKSVALAPMLCGSGASANAERLEIGTLFEMVGANLLLIFSSSLFPHTLTVIIRFDLSY
jgi:hypothetical protein